MKNATSHLLALLCLLGATFQARAASSTVLNVTGIITPSACEVLLSGNGIVDHGRLPARSLNQYEFSPLPMRPLDLSVSCNEPVLFVLVGLDNRAHSSLGPGFYYGLGNNIHAPGERLGTVSLAFRNVVADSVPALVLASSNQGLTWFPEANAYPGNFTGFAKPGTLVPEPHRLLNATLHINTSINAAAVLTLNQEVPLDGSIVLDLRYM
ncbi:MAG: Protein GltF [Pseudomonas sp.]|nr:MAG: Protein GltF [Pseudomonas sp.]